MNTATVEGVRQEHTLGARVPHAAWCDGRHGVAYLEDERVLSRLAWAGDVGPLFVAAVLDQVEGELLRRGLEVLRVSRSRRNAAGLGIGPEVLVRSCEVDRVRFLLRQARANLDRVGSDCVWRFTEGER